MYGRLPVLPIELEKKASPDEEEYSNFDEKVAVMKKIRDEVKAQATSTSTSLLLFLSHVLQLWHRLQIAKLV